MLPLLACLTVACVASAQAQPPACTDDDHCPTGLFCDAYFCTECLLCNNYNRKSPAVATKCVTSVKDCGSCFEGLVLDRSEGSNGGCRTPSPAPVADSFPFVWLGVGIGLAFIIAILAVCVYTCKNSQARVSKLHFTSFFCPRPAARIEVEASAPPPYNAACNDYHPDTNGYHNYGQEAAPLVKPVWGGGEGRAAEASQSARPYNAPSGYVRNAHLTDGPGAPSHHVEDETLEPSPPDVHDDDTRESVWTPYDAARNDNNDSAVGGVAAAAGGVDGAAGVAGAAGGAGAGAGPLLPLDRRGSITDLDVTEPPAKIMRQDSNMSSGRDDDSEQRPSAAAAAAVMVNLHLNINTKSIQHVNNMAPK